MPPESRGKLFNAASRGQQNGVKQQKLGSAPRGIATMRPVQALEPTERAAGHAGRQFRKKQESGEIS
ncbi:hypothetical protein [Cupriavidus alkaliphilus]|uniref:hypothetical protein n=1 Tax=Cupriavidus alkaliphilus TaxID=942866 RepID=UPI00160DEA88|nr:hypothetical protein [Cupriavidus alkaliphilus]MBB3013570.1 hypothetical protein [Cupriavidus alkaliphilus]